MPCVVCNKKISPSKTIPCYECKLNFHPSCTQLVNIANFNKLGKNKDLWKCETCSNKQNFTIHKVNNGLNNDVDPSEQDNLMDLGVIQFSIKSILIKLKQLDLLAKSFSDKHKCY